MGNVDVGVIGLAVMGENLALNIESRGHSIAVYNRTISKIERFVSTRAKGKDVVGAKSIEELCSVLSKPRKLIVMVKAGKPVDEFIDSILPYLSQGDILIDGGNSFYLDTIRRTEYLGEKGILFVGAGISGGEEGALHGPSIMPGGASKAWPEIRGILQSIAAKVDDNAPCCEWIGNDGAGHYVKMVHNGIEYSDMQLICEAYHLMDQGLGLSAFEIHEIFKNWNQGPLDSYLLEITEKILAHTDEESGNPTIDNILDTAGQKGTGKWTSVSGLDLGVPIPQITQAVFARCMSSMKDERVIASGILHGPQQRISDDKNEIIEKLHNALYASKICSYAQGFQLMKAAAEEFGWELNLGEISLLWRGGCIIRARFLKNIKEAFDRDRKLNNLLLDPYFSELVMNAQDDWRYIVKKTVDCGIPAPSMMSALNYYDAYRCSRLPANLLQAQRDFFGAHTYERVDRPRGEFFHTNWTGQGGDTFSSSYNA